MAYLAAALAILAILIALHQHRRVDDLERLISSQHDRDDAIEGGLVELSENAANHNFGGVDEKVRTVLMTGMRIRKKV